MLHAIKPGPGVLPGNGMVIEAILTFNLLFVALSVTNPRGKIAIMPSLPIAFCIGTGIMAAVRLILFHSECFLVYTVAILFNSFRICPSIQLAKLFLVVVYLLILNTVPSTTLQ